jgi:ethanolamine permease
MKTRPEVDRGGVARYEDVDRDYLAKRRLRPSAGWVLLWALGVGAVISGDFYGWQFGLAAGGFGGLAVATLVMAVMYLAMVFSIAELSAALPHAGGFYSFVRNALGPTAGYVCGITDTIEYVLTPAVVVVGIGGYLAGQLPAVPEFVWWLGFYAVFVAVNVRGVELTLKVGLLVTLLAVVVLVVFFAGAIVSSAFDPELLLNIAPAAGGAAEGDFTRWLPKGWAGVVAALPAAIWFFLAIEQLPLAAEETHDVVRSMPRALVFGILTLLGLSLLTLVLNSGVGGGAAAMADSKAPLRDGFVAVFGDGPLTSALTFLALAGLVASFHTIIYAYGRVLFALSRAGYFPRWISPTNRHHSPHRALLVGAAVGLGCAVAIGAFGEESDAGKVLLNMAVFGAVISYTMVLVSFIKLRLTRPDLKRPYRSPLGVPGAALGAALSLLALAATLLDAEVRKGVWGLAAFLGIALVYYFFHSRKQLVAQAPEEEAALVARAQEELERPSCGE